MLVGNLANDGDVAVLFHIVATVYLGVERENPIDDVKIVEQGRDIEGVEVSIFLHQKENVTNGYKISLRSKDYVNVSDICLMYGGGGHPRAAGAFLNGTPEQIKEKLMFEIKKQLK